MGGTIRQFIRRRTLLTADILNTNIVDWLFQVLVGGKGIQVKKQGQKIVVESTSAAVGGTGSNGVWV